MAAIKVENYQNITSLYTSAQLQVVGISDYYYEAAREIVLLQTFDPELDLLAPFWQAYLAATTAYANPPSAVITAVASLQSHILDKARTDAGAVFTNINAWIDAGATNGYLTAAVGRQNETGTGDESFKIEEQFAALSAKAGYAIDADNIL